MDNEAREQLLDQLASRLGNESFNKLQIHAKSARNMKELYFWQEKLFEQAGIAITSPQQYFSLFESVPKRSTGRPQDAIVAATADFWAPTLKEHGFRKHGQRNFARITSGCILQWIGPWLSSYGDRDIRIPYTSLILTRERTDCSPYYRFLPRMHSPVGSWPALEHVQADRSFKDICQKTVELALPWFAATSTPRGLATALLAEQETGDAWRSFDIGCAFASANDPQAAVHHLRIAARQFADAFAANSERDWASAALAEVEALIAAIQAGQEKAALENGLARSVANLKLQKLF